MKLATVHSASYGNIYDVRINTDNIDYFLDKSGTTGNQSTIYFAGGDDLEVMESVEEIENLIYSIPKDMVRRTLEELKNASEYLKEENIKL